MKKENIVVLCYANNSCYTSVITLEEAEKKFGEHLELDLPNKKWRFQDGEYNNNQFWDIGRTRYIIHGRHFGVIGLYDRTDIKHLGYMVSGTQYATDEPNYGDD